MPLYTIFQGSYNQYRFCHVYVVGSVIGSMILSLGFYTVIWGKAREDASKTVTGFEQSPLLLTHVVDDEALSLR